MTRLEDAYSCPFNGPRSTARHRTAPHAEKHPFSQTVGCGAVSRACVFRRHRATMRPEAAVDDDPIQDPRV